MNESNVIYWRTFLQKYAGEHDKHECDTFYPSFLRRDERLMRLPTLAQTR